MNDGVVTGLAGVAQALKRIAERDPLVLVSKTRREYWAEIDSWELRFMAVTNLSREEVYAWMRKLPTNRHDGNPDLEILRHAYTEVGMGITLTDTLAIERRHHSEQHNQR